MTGLYFRKLRLGAAVAGFFLMFAGTIRLLAAHVIDPLQALFASGAGALCAVLLAMLPAEGPEARALSLSQQPTCRSREEARRQHGFSERWIGGLEDAA